MTRLRLALPLAAIVAVALIVTFVAGLSAGQASAPAPEGDAVGVTVRGEWLVSVVNADGTVAQEHAFHNEFNGASNIAPILAHTSSTGRYWLTLSDQTGGGAHPCGDPNAAAQSCFIFEPDDPNASVPWWFGNLAVSTASGQVVVRGEVLATRAGQFNNVRMLLSRCASTTAPSSCTPGAYGNFSARTLDTPITVVAGQQIIVTVTYSFSAAP